MARPLVREIWPARALIFVTVLGFAASVFANWPGHFPPDAISQLAQGRAGVFNLWHPPVMAWLLGVADRLWPHAPLFFVFDTALFFAASVALAMVEGAGWLAAIGMALVAASPLVLVYQGLVVKDVLFADVSLAAFAAIAWTGKAWPRPWMRASLFAASLALLILVCLARQNGFVVGGVGALTLAGVAFAHSPRSTRRRTGMVTALAALLAIGAVSWAASARLAALSDRQPEAARQWMTLQVYDLAGVVRRDPGVPLAVLRLRAPALERFVRDKAAPVFDPGRVDTIARLQAWPALVAKPSPWLGAQWRSLIATSPTLYLSTRWSDFWRVLATPDVQACAPILVGVDPGDPKLLRAAGLSARDSDKDDWDRDYAAGFLATPVFSHLFYAALAAVLLALGIRDVARGRRALIATVGLLIAAFAFTSSFFAISIACDYRYLYFLDVAAMAALVQRLALWRRKPSDLGA